MSVDTCSKLFQYSGLKVEYIAGWENRGFDILDPTASLVHYTWGIFPSDLHTCIEGRPTLSGPLCNWYVAPDGTIYVVAARQAHHAGVGVLPSVNSYGIEVSWIDPKWTPNLDGTDAKPWPAVQRESIVAMLAIICKLHNWTAGRVFGHKETARPIGRKFDPALSMMLLRNDVLARMDGLKPADDEDDFLSIFASKKEFEDTVAVATKRGTSAALTVMGQPNAAETIDVIISDIKGIKDEVAEIRGTLEAIPAALAAMLKDNGQTPPAA